MMEIPSKSNDALYKSEVDELMVSIREFAKELYEVYWDSSAKARRDGKQVTHRGLKWKYELENLIGIKREGRLDSNIRVDKVDKCINILIAREKNNIVLVGEHDEISAIIEGLAWRIENEEVPTELLNYKILSLDIAALSDRANLMRDFEDRLQTLLNEERESNKIILFIHKNPAVAADDITFGSMDAANLLVYAMYYGELHLICATMPDEYRIYIEKNPAMECCFQQVYVLPTSEDGMSTLLGEHKILESRHRIQISDSAIIEALNLSERHYSGYNRVDKAIGLMDEAASTLKVDISFTPTPLDFMYKSVLRQAQMLGYIASEADQQFLEDNMDRLEASLFLLKEKIWEYETSNLITIQPSNNQFYAINHKPRLYERDPNHAEESVRYRLNILQTLEKEIVEHRKCVKSNLRREVTGLEITKIVEKDKGTAPTLVQKPKKGEQIHTKVKLNNQAVTRMLKAIHHQSQSARDHCRIASFLFVGASGVGKIAFAKHLSFRIFGAKEAPLLQIYVREYFDVPISRMMDTVRKNPCAVLMFGDIEKAHPRVLDVLLRILSYGKLTDHKGRIVSFTNTLIIITSNLGLDSIFKIDENATSSLEFPPEFINHVDEYIIFHPLERQQLDALVKLQLEEVQKRLDVWKVNVEVSEAAVELIGHRGYDRRYGTTAVKCVFQQYIEKQLKKSLSRGEFKAGVTVLMDAQDAASSVSGLPRHKLIFTESHLCSAT